MNATIRKISCWVTGLLLTVSLAAPAAATVLYDNGPDALIYGDWLINNGQDVSDPFTLNSSSVLTGVTVSLRSNLEWPALSLFWNISLEPSGLDSISFGTAALSPRGNTQEVGINWLQAYQTFALPDILLSAGNYWLTLGNAQVSSDASAYIAWGISDPDRLDAVWNGSEGKPVQSFQILGEELAMPAPEPSTALLFALGAVGVGGLALLKRTKEE